MLFLELKNEIGLGNCDPYLQAAWSYTKWWTSGSNGKIAKKHICPCFLVCIAGPWICVCGALILDKAVADWLTFFIPTMNTKDYNHLIQLA